MIHFGEQLKTLREVRGYSLEYIEQAIQIRRPHLIALEEGDYRGLPEEFQSISLVERYAAMLGMNMDEAVEEFRYSLYTYQKNQDNYNLKRPASDVYTPMPHEMEKPKKSLEQVKVAGIPLFNLSVALIFLIAVLWIGNALVLPWISAHMGWGAGSESFYNVNQSTAQRAEAPIKAQPSRGEEPKKTMAGEASPTGDKKSAGVVGTAPAGPLVLDISAEANSWMKITVDGVDQFEGILQKGQTRHIEAHAMIKLKTSNAAGIAVSLNGESLKPLGEINEVVEKEFK